MCSGPHPYSTLILGVFPLHQIAHVVGQQAHISLKLFGREIILKVFQHMRSRYLNVTDWQMDDMKSHNRALHSIARQWFLRMVHAKNYETVSNFLMLCRENCGFFFSGHGVDSLLSVLDNILNYITSHFTLCLIQHTQTFMTFTKLSIYDSGWYLTVN